MEHSKAITGLDVPKTFSDAVRDALLNVHDLAYLQSRCSLIRFIESGPGIVARGRTLRRELFDAIEELRPGRGVAATSHLWRTHRILELRYVEGGEAGDVIGQVALSRAQYHREHHRALQDVALILWERWKLAGRWSTNPDDLITAYEATQNVTRQHGSQLLPDENVGRIDPVEAIHGVIGLVQPLCARHNVSLSYSLQDPLAPLWGERVALRHALLAVLAHAIAASRGGSLRISAVGGPHSIQIQMSGVAKNCPDLEQFGLAEFRPFVEALQGQLSFRQPAATSGHWEISLIFPTSDRPTLVVVDNNADFIRLVERYLFSHAWEVVGVSDIDRAFSFIANQPPEAILLDIVMPGRDGWDLLVDLEADPRTRLIPVIICSVLNGPETANLLGARSYLQKPINERQLVGALAGLI